MSWMRLRAKFLYDVIDKRAGSYQPPLLAVSIHRGVVPRSTLTDDLPRAEDLSNYKLCAPGDIVLNRMRAFQGAIGISPQQGLVSPDYMVLRPNEAVEARYFHHLFRSTWFVGEMVSRLRGIGGTESGTVRTPRINPEDLGDISVPVPPLDEQRRIADFLDAETTRIDQLASLQKNVLAKLDDRRRSVLEEVLAPTGTPGSSVGLIPLGYLTEYSRPIMYGIVLPGPNVPDGVPIVKGGDVAAGRLSVGQLNRTSHEIEAGYARSRLRGGDLVIAIRGSVGEIGVVPDELTGANLTQDAARIAPGPRVDRLWLELVLQTPSLSRQIQSRITGATVKGINIWDLRRIQVPWIPEREQLVAAREVVRALSPMSRLASATRNQLTLLSERRQALITAAVTGQFDVTTARKGS